jgi:hypothetical protein
MGLKTGDKAKHYRERRKKNVRRARTRALRKELEERASTTPAPAARVVAPEPT